MKNGKILGKTKQNWCYEKIDIIFSVVLLLSKSKVWSEKLLSKEI